MPGVSSAHPVDREQKSSAGTVSYARPNRGQPTVGKYVHQARTISTPREQSSQIFAEQAAEFGRICERFV